MPEEFIFLRKVGIKPGMSLFFREGTLFFIDETNPLEQKQIRFDGGDDKIWVGKDFKLLNTFAEILANSHNLHYEVVVPFKQIRFIAP